MQITLQSFYVSQIDIGTQSFLMSVNIAMRRKCKNDKQRRAEEEKGRKVGVPDERKRIGCQRPKMLTVDLYLWTKLKFALLFI